MQYKFYILFHFLLKQLTFLQQKYSHPSVPMGKWSQDPPDTQIRQCSSLFLYKMALYLHITSTGIQATSEYAYTSFHSSGFSVLLSMWQIQVLLYGTFWDSFSPKYFRFMVESANEKPVDEELTVQ